MDLKLTTETLALLERHRMTFAMKPGARRMRAGDELRIAKNALIEPYTGVFRGQTLPGRLGAFTYSHSALHELWEIGRYCSIAAGVQMMGNGHPIDWATTSPFAYGSVSKHSNFVLALEDAKIGEYNGSPLPKKDKRVRIGNDVWIGSEVLLAQGITIGDGAVIAARSVVTKDVEPYALVAGSPARVKKLRFPAEVVQRYLEVQWWQFNFADLVAINPKDPVDFIEKVAAMAATGEIQPYKPTPLSAHDLVSTAGEAMAPV